MNLTKPLNVNHELPLEEREDDSDARCEPPGRASSTDDVVTDIILWKR